MTTATATRLRDAEAYDLVRLTDRKARKHVSDSVRRRWGRDVADTFRVLSSWQGRTGVWVTILEHGGTMPEHERDQFDLAGELGVEIIGRV